MVAVFFIATIRQDLVAVVGAAAGVLAGIGAGAAAVVAAGPRLKVIGAAAGVLAGAGAGAGAVAGAVVVEVVVVGAAAVAVSLAAAVEGTTSGTAAAVAVAVAAGAVVRAAVGAVVMAAVGAVAVAVSLAAAVTGVGIYIAWRALAGDEKHAFIRIIAVALAATGGTSFSKANLTDANFTQANLKNTDFREAILTRTCWYETKKLDLARVGNSILAKAEVRDLLVTRNGEKKSYIGANLQGANLAGANLNQANLKEADISQANFQRANLEGTNLTKVQALGTDFTNAYLTGACLEAWNIDSTTKLENVDSRFVYLLEYPYPESDNRERRPSSGKFAPGEFTKLFQEVLNTVDLIFRNGVDWRAFITAFKKVQVENEGTELAIQSIENKGDGVVVVKVCVPEDANKEKIHLGFTQNYELALNAIEAKYEVQLKGKDEQLTIYRQQNADMWLTINKLAEKPVNVVVNARAESKAMTDSTDQSRKIDNKDGNVIGNILGDNSTISGTVAQTINQLPDEPKSEQPGIKELLNQLHQAIAAETSLNPEDKAEALAQLQTLAEAGKNPKNPPPKRQRKQL